MKATTPLVDRIERHYTPEPNTGCWLWTGSLTGAGYGQISAGRRGLRLLFAHRAMYEMRVGQIPEGLDLDHLCRVRSCINPGHLEPVTRFENLRRGDTMIARQVARTHCPRGHEYSPENTYRYRGSRRCRACSRDKRAARASR